MSKKGVSKISGNNKPKISERTVYKVTQWYPDTPMQDRDESKVNWILYKEIKTGKLTKITEKKGVGEFTFTNKAKNGTYVLEGYLHQPELKGDSVIKINPVVASDAKTDKEKAIQWITLNHSDGTKITKALSYMDKLTAVAKCANMEGLQVIFTLWEDDEKGAGHNTKNEFITKSSPIVVDSKGYARWHFTLLNTFIKLAQKREDDDKQHEYYVTIDYNGGTKASGNVNVNNPNYKIEVPKKVTPKKEQPKKEQPKTKPKENTAKTSTNPISKNNTKDAKGFITKLSLTGKDKRTITDRPKFGESIYLTIHGKNLKNKKFTLKLWEDDNTGANDLLLEQKFEFTKDNALVIEIKLTKEMQKIGEYGNNSKDPDIGEYWTGNFQEIFAEVILETISSKSQIIKVDINETFKANYDKSPAVVNEKPESKRTTSGKCPNCDKDITLEEIKYICKKKIGKNEISLIKNETIIKKALPFLNIYRKVTGINTCITKAHFLSQISQESKFYILEEDFNYYWEALIKTFSAFQTEEGKKKAKLWGRKIKEKNSKGYEPVSYNNQINIANWAYKDNNKNGDFSSGDGSKFRGRGFKQITWKSNYIDLSNYFNEKIKIKSELPTNWKDNYLNLTENHYDAIVSAITYWKKNNISSIAIENSDACVEKVTKKINPALKGLKDRQFFFKRAVEVLNVNTCTLTKINPSEEATVVIVSGSVVILQNDPAIAGLQWIMYKTSIYNDISLQTYKKLKNENKLPNPNYVSYLSRDTHQVTNSKKTEIYKHSEKRFGKYNEVPPGEYFLVPGLQGQKYTMYVIDNENKSASDENGISGIHGDRGGIALHQYCPRFSVGCFTFNSGKNTEPVKKFREQLKYLEINDKKPTHFIVEPRDVKEITWDNPEYGTKKWVGK